jgi:predicted membrane channel-forming protein YqfA (hemolysin III family)
MPRRPPAVASATGPGPLQPEGAEEEAAGFLDASALPVSEPARHRRGSSRWGKPGDRLDSAWWRLRSIAQAPRFLHQPHVLTGYRKQLTAWEAARSAFMLHNETGAIWTHLIGALVFVVLAVRVGTWGVVGDAPYLQASPEPHVNDTLTPSALHELFAGSPGFPAAASCLLQLPHRTAESPTAADCLGDIKAWAFAAGPLSAVPSEGNGLEPEGLRRLPAVDPGEGRAPLHGVYAGVRRLVQDAGSRFQAAAEKVGKNALPPSCASNSTATWTTCIPLLESLEAAMLGAGGELSRLSDRLQSTVICGDSQCFNLTAAVSADEHVRELIEQAHGKAQLLFTEALAKATLQTSFVRDAVKADLSALRGQIAAYQEEGADKLATARQNGAAAAHRLRNAVGRLLSNATKSIKHSVARGARVGVGVAVPSIPAWMWSDFHSARSAGWARAMEAVREAETNLAKVALDVTAAGGSAAAAVGDEADDGSSSHSYAHVAHEHVWPLVGYLISATVCLWLSAVYHCFGTAMSRPMHDLFARLDFAGITTLILGSGFAVIYYTFYCRPLLQQRYLAVYTMIGLPKMVACTMRWYAAPQRESLRVLNFLAFGFCGSFMVMHGMYLELFAVGDGGSGASGGGGGGGGGDGGGGGGDPSGNLPATIEAGAATVWEASAALEAQAHAWSLFAKVLAMGAAYLSGTFVFVTHLPESRWPGRFDNCCASHQLWHVFVILAAYILWTGLRDYAAWRIATPCHY